MYEETRLPESGAKRESGEIKFRTTRVCTSYKNKFAAARQIAVANEIVVSPVVPLEDRILEELVTCRAHVEEDHLCIKSFLLVLKEDGPVLSG